LYVADTILEEQLNVAKNVSNVNPTLKTLRKKVLEHHKVYQQYLIYIYKNKSD